MYIASKETRLPLIRPGNGKTRFDFITDCFLYCSNIDQSWIHHFGLQRGFCYYYTIMTKLYKHYPQTYCGRHHQPEANSEKLYWPQVLEHLLFLPSVDTVHGRWPTYVWSNYTVRRCIQIYKGSTDKKWKQWKWGRGNLHYMHAPPSPTPSLSWGDIWLPVVHT